VAAATTLAFETPVLHDISIGGAAVALAEIAIASGIGVMVDGMSGADLFDETPLRFLAVSHGDELDTTEPHIRIGTMSGKTLDFGEAGSIDLTEATSIWREALPRRMT
jgi:phosphoribosylformylglycinamidine synthase